MKHRYGGHKVPRSSHYQKDDIRSLRAERAKTARMLRQVIVVVGLLLSTALLVGIYRTLTWAPTAPVTPQLAAVHPRMHTHNLLSHTHKDTGCLLSQLFATTHRFSSRPDMA